MNKNSNTPWPISQEEWAEIYNVTEFREGWGLETDDKAAEIQPSLYGVRFDYVSGSPGYVGSLYLVQGDGGPDIPPLVFVRDQHGRLVSAT